MCLRASDLPTGPKSSSYCCSCWSLASSACSSRKTCLCSSLFYEIAVLPMYLLIGIWGSSHKVTEAGPLRFVWKWFDIGGREYAAMKLTLMLLVGSAFILVGLLALYFSSGAGTFDMAVLAKAHYPKSLQIWTFVMFWLGFGSLAGVFPFSRGRPMVTHLHRRRCRCSTRVC